MTDPAISAAQRAWDNDQLSCWPSQNAEAGAREMAKSVQELHKPEPGYGINDDGIPWTSCAECGCEWPCETAKRVYPSEELNK
ncbi:hypothetical protein [Mycobacteroides abscessus]|uniref:hypothetical protein n=1 Tax=Mycobacteroides abscessus TaxID=36809 RepID=UPI0018966B04